MKQDFLGLSCEKFRGSCNGNIWEGNPNGTERNVPNGNSCSIFSKPSLIIQVSGLWGRFFVMELICVNGISAIQGRNFPVLDFAYYLAKLWTGGFAREGKQPMEDLQLSTYLPGHTFAHFFHLHYHFQISKYLRDSPLFMALSRLEHNWAFLGRCKQSNQDIQF